MTTTWPWGIVIHGDAGENGGFGDVADGPVVLFLDQDLVHAQDKVGAHGARDAVEIVVWAWIALEQARFVILGIVQFAHPGAFHHLEGFPHHQGKGLIRMLSCHLPLFQGEDTMLHFFLRLVAGKAQPHRFFEVFLLVGDKVEGASAVAEQVLCRIAGVAGTEKHGIIIPSRHIVGLEQGISAQ